MTVELVIENFTVARNGRPVVREVNLQIPEGEVTALLGPNGAGKSSLVLGVAGLLPVEGGAVRVGDLDLTGRRPERIRQAGVAVVPEGRRLLSELTVEDNLAVACYALSRRRTRRAAWPGRSSCSPSSSSATTRRRARCRAASSRCSCSPRRSSPSRGSC